MASLRERLGRLEARAPLEQRETPIEVSVLLTAIKRHRANLRGEELPPFTPEERAEMHREDLEIVAGSGVVGGLRDSGGWEDADSRAFLDRLQDHARHRLRGGDAME